MVGEGRRGRGGGTRVRLFPQARFLDGFGEPVTVELSVPAGSCGAGPVDARFETVVPIGKVGPYGPGTDRFGRPSWSGPPWRGRRALPARPDRFGHFDGIAVGDPAFLAAHAYGCARFALDVLEGYCGPVPWHFGRSLPRLEVLCQTGYDNAHCGWGFLELGWNLKGRGLSHPYALNMDTVAHEMGHLVLFSLMGHADGLFLNGEYGGFHEAMADLAAFLVAAHLDPVVDAVLRATRGNLYIANELSRIVELAPADQIRNLGHGVKMDQFRGGWSDEHDLSLPLAGAFFDILVEVYQTLLVDAGLLSPEIVEIARNVDAMLAFEHPVDAAFAAAYAAEPRPFRAAFASARDVLGHLLARLWRRLDPVGLTYAEVARQAVLVERGLTGGRFERAVRTSFAWRSIGVIAPGPRVRDPLRPRRRAVCDRAVRPPLQPA